MQRYLDYNATCPTLACALDALSEVTRRAAGNASSVHWAGRAARRVLDDAREAVAAFIGADAGSLVFTSGGTEANNLAIYGWLSGQPLGRIVVSAIEHPSVLKPAARWAEAGWEIVTVRPDGDGVVSAAAIAEQITEDTRLVCLMAANNETGAVQPVADVGRLCRDRDIPLLVDAVQALAKIDVDVAAWQADFVSFSAHKIGGPKGVGALMVRRGRQLRELAPGGGQERGRRSGTENVPGIAGFAAALGKADFRPLRSLRDAFEQKLKQEMHDVHVFAEHAQRLPNTSMFCLPGLEGETLLMQLDMAGFAVASGSACSSGKRDPSHVLLAMGCTEDESRASIRVSFGPDNTLADAEALVAELVRVRKRLKAMAGMAR